MDQGDPKGFTPLMIAVREGHARVASILLKRRANVSVSADCGTTALHASAKNGHLAMAVDLIRAGAYLDAEDADGLSPLHLAATAGHSKVVAAMIKAGADLNSRSEDGRTPLFCAAVAGRMGAFKELLRAKANPLLKTHPTGGTCILLLEATVLRGRSKVVRELIETVGIEGCGGESGGADALEAAAQEGHLGIMAILMDAGVVDTGIALHTAAGCGREAAVEFLL